MLFLAIVLGSFVGFWDPQLMQAAFQVLQMTFRLKLLHEVAVSQNYGYLFGGPHNKDYRILGSILGSSFLGKLPSAGHP